MQRGKDAVREDAGRKCDADAPARFQADVDVREGHEHAEQHAHDDGPRCQLRQPVALIDVLEPMPFDVLGGLVGRALATQNHSHV